MIIHFFNKSLRASSVLDAAQAMPNFFLVTWFSTREGTVFAPPMPSLLSMSEDMEQGWRGAGAHPSGHTPPPVCTHTSVHTHPQCWPQPVRTYPSVHISQCTHPQCTHPSVCTQPPVTHPLSGHTPVHTHPSVHTHSPQCNTPLSGHTPTSAHTPLSAHTLSEHTAPVHTSLSGHTAP